MYVFLQNLRLFPNVSANQRVQWITTCARVEFPEQLLTRAFPVFFLRVNMTAGLLRVPLYQSERTELQNLQFARNLSQDAAQCREPLCREGNQAVWSSPDRGKAISAHRCVTAEICDMIRASLSSPASALGAVICSVSSFLSVLPSLALPANRCACWR